MKLTPVVDFTKVFCARFSLVKQNITRKKMFVSKFARKTLVTLTPGVDFTKLCAPRKHLPAHSIRKKISPFNFTNILPQTLPICGEMKFATLMCRFPNLFVICQSPLAKKIFLICLRKKVWQ